ncbi:S-layer homology domain-containing protein [Saccharibacillus sacchari]|uniref:S-layer homology domain-containing protein n=1 Tax=Saccharibacillus sacchari TaxID=456493 RepID=UPI0030EE0075
MEGIPISNQKPVKRTFALLMAALLLFTIGFNIAPASGYAVSPVTVYDPTDLKDQSVTLNAEVSFIPGSNAEFGFYYWLHDESPNGKPLNALKVPTNQVFPGISTTSFKLDVTGLQPGKAYDYTAYYIADNTNSSNQPQESQPFSFTTYLYVSYLSEAVLSQVPNGTKASSIQWPTTVTATLSDSTTIELPVTWDYSDYESAPLYIDLPSGWTFSDAGGFKNFKGVVTLPNDGKTIFDPNGYWSADDAVLYFRMDYPDLTGIPSVPGFSVPKGTAVENVAGQLPATLTLSYSNNKTAATPIEWDDATPVYDGATPGTYTFTGTPQCLYQMPTFARGTDTPISVRAPIGGCGFNNPQNLTAKAVVTVTDLNVTPTPNPNPTPVTTVPTPTTTAPSTRSVQVIVTNPNGGQTASVPITDLIGNNLSLRGALYNANGQPVAGVSELTLSSNGTLNIPSSLPSGTYRLALNVVAPSGERLAGPPATLTVDSAGNATLNAELIDPYGIITDSSTGQPIPGVKTTLYWADTANNRANGRVPGTVVQLPALPDFAPNQNADPQISNAQGEYGWMVFPESDYYIIAEKDGYANFDSRNSNVSATFGTDSYIRAGNIHVGQTIVEYNFTMQSNVRQYIAYMRGYPNGKFEPQQGVKRSEVAAILNRTMQASGTASNAATNFADVPASNWAHEDIRFVVEQGWMQGTSATLFQPNRSVTRAELAQILMNVYGWTPETGGTSFSDIQNNWASEAIRTAAAQGLLNGYSDGTFRPDQPISRAETVTLINRLTERPSAPELPMTWSDVPVSTWAYGDIMAASLDH